MTSPSLWDQLQLAHFGCQNALLQCIPQQLLELGLRSIPKDTPNITLGAQNWVMIPPEEALFSV